MKKPIRNAGTAGAAATLVAGALLATAGSAAAATPGYTGHTAAAAAAVPAGHDHSRPQPLPPHFDPWVADQPAQFDPAAKHRLAVYDPWVKDQLALFAPAAG
jgi:hypothetical protein